MYQVTSWTHRTELPGDLASAALARDFVRFHLVEHGFPVEDLRLVTSELATNAICHAETTFTVTLQGDNESVMLTVRDGSALAPVLLLAPVIDTGGRGLAVVEGLSDRWGTAPNTDGGIPCGPGSTSTRFPERLGGATALT